MHNMPTQPPEKELVERWKAEQHLIASQVVIRDDHDWICLERVSCDDNHNVEPINLNLENETTPAISVDAATTAARTNSDTLVITRTHRRFTRLGHSRNKSILFGGVDVSFPENEGDPSVATYVILEANSAFSNLSVVYRDFQYIHLTIPYISSFLAFREIEPLENLIKKQIKTHPHLTPSVILVDGNGILHCRHAGIACFVGVKTGIPTIGVGKTLYCQDGLQKDLVRTRIHNSVLAAASLINGGFDSGIHLNRNKLLPPPLQQQWQSHWSQPILLDRTASMSFGRSNRKDKRDDGDDMNAQLSEEEDKIILQQNLAFLSHHCMGVAINLEGTSCRVLCAALVGHGGGRRGNKTIGVGGTKNPIFISVGHNMSLEESIVICAELSTAARIPEPVRQADLWGRKLIRQAKRNR